MAFEGASSRSRSGRSSHAAPSYPMTGAMTRPETGCRCPACAASATVTAAAMTATAAARLLPLDGGGWSMSIWLR